MPDRRRWASWSVAVLLAVWAVVRLTGFELGWFLTQLMTLTPYGAVLALSAAVLLAFRNRPAALVALGAAVAMLATVLPRVFAGSAPEGGASLRVLTLNLFGRADPAEVVRLVDRYDADVFTALELTPGQVSALKAAGLERRLPYQVLEASEGPVGSGVYARFPLTRIDGLFTVIGHNMPAARVAAPSGAVEVVAIHPNPPLPRLYEEWNASLAALPAARPGVRRILAGDFNAGLDHRAFRDLLGKGYRDAAAQAGQGLTPTWPSGRAIPPIITIDHILVDRSIGVRRVEVSDVRGTDHRAVFADLRLG
ncbi:endonuclease/exonuclease/phosphatase family protein [Nonomuraea typhae]|uniref:endonuclease/exonuclease/phosphatase family protein n=1 Tax=Nonomuraea typhae TaxID=2603600 RepID=UPI0012FB30A6|nr:endonuclease/exonuclease/phosphatase family protein [Nonomuraea typhae]